MERMLQNTIASYCLDYTIIRTTTWLNKFGTFHAEYRVLSACYTWQVAAGPPWNMPHYCFTRIKCSESSSGGWLGRRWSRGSHSSSCSVGTASWPCEHKKGVWGWGGEGVRGVHVRVEKLSNYYMARWNLPCMLVAFASVCVCVCLCIIRINCPLASVASFGDIAIIFSEQLCII